MINIVMTIQEREKGHVGVELMHRGDQSTQDEREYMDMIIEGLRKTLESMVSKTGGQIIETQHQKTDNNQPRT